MAPEGRSSLWNTHQGGGWVGGAPLPDWKENVRRNHLQNIHQHACLLQVRYHLNSRQVGEEEKKGRHHLPPV